MSVQSLLHLQLSINPVLSHPCHILSIDESYDNHLRPNITPNYVPSLICSHKLEMFCFFLQLCTNKTQTAQIFTCCIRNNKALKDYRQELLRAYIRPNPGLQLFFFHVCSHGSLPCRLQRKETHFTESLSLLLFPNSQKTHPTYITSLRWFGLSFPFVSSPLTLPFLPISFTAPFDFN